MSDNVDIRRLESGLTVVSEQVPHVRSVAIGFWVNAGSRDEEAREQGVSHLLEHLLFKGTDRRSARELAEVMDHVGGQLNAFTTKEYTSYYARVLDEHLPVAMDVLSDMIRNSLHREEDLEREKGVIDEEIGMYEDTPDELVHDLFAQALWRGHPLGRPVLGTRETVGGLRRQDVVGHFDARYAPDNTVLAVAGSFEPARLFELLDEHLGSWRASGRKQNGVAPEPGVATELVEKATELVHLCIGGPGLPLEDPGSYALSIMSNILGGGPSSRLFQEVREERGLAYSVFSYTAAFRDCGLFSIYCGAGADRIRAALEVIGQQLRLMATEGVSEVELERAKAQLKSGMTMSLESTSSRMNRIGRSQLLLGRIISLDEVLRRVQAVTVEDIRRLAAAFCDPGKLTLVAIGPGLERLGLRGVV
ncbi:MAG: pitrilysin family protein [Bacillota bacterium]|nr:pitrilysin family protein [Bacillota bacterium]